MIETLTARQAQVLRTIVQFTFKRGYPPTLRELGRRLHIGSTNGVSDHLRALERKGYIRRARMLSRGIRVVRAV